MGIRRTSAQKIPRKPASGWGHRVVRHGRLPDTVRGSWQPGHLCRRRRGRGLGFRDRSMDADPAEKFFTAGAQGMAACLRRLNGWVGLDARPRWPARWLAVAVTHRTIAGRSLALLRCRIGNKPPFEPTDSNAPPSDAHVRDTLRVRRVGDSCVHVGMVVKIISIYVLPGRRQTWDTKFL